MTRSSQQTYIQRLGFQDKDRSNPRHGLACEYLLDRLIQRQFISKSFMQRLKNNSLQWGTEWREERINEIKVRLEYNAKSLKHGWASAESIEAENQQLTQELDKLQSEIDCLPQIVNSASDDDIAQRIYESMPSNNFISVPIASGKFINGFADVLLNCYVSLNFQDNLAIESKCSTDRDCFSRNQLQKSILGEIKITKEPAENVIQQIAFYRQFVYVKEVIILIDYDDPQLKRMTAGSDIHVYKLGSKFDAWCAAKTQPLIEEF